MCTPVYRSSVNKAVSLSFCHVVKNGALVSKLRRLWYKGSDFAPRWPVVSCRVRCLHLVIFSNARCTTWNGSITFLAFGNCCEHAVA